MTLTLMKVKKSVQIINGKFIEIEVHWDECLLKYKEEAFYFVNILCTNKKA